MPYTTQGYMTLEDIAEVRRDMDLDLCPCCESGDGGWYRLDDPDQCANCGHDSDGHA